MRIEDMTLDEKVDEILKYQRKLHRMAIVRGIISFTLFMVLIVLPLVGFYYWFQNFSANFGMSLSEVSDTLKNAGSLGDLNDLEGKIDIEELQKLLQ